MSKLLKTLALTGMTALSAAAVFGFTQNQASAKTYARVVYNQTMPQAGTSRNVVTTGSYGLYSKAGTLRGARLVASKNVLSYMGTSNDSNDYFRAYRVAQTNTGSIYYKVVSFDQQYRGWIYGGRSANTFASGVNVTNTTNGAPLSNDEATKTYTFTNPGTANVTWNYPNKTQYKAQKVVSSTAPYAGDDLKIDRAVTMSREGTKYYYVTSAQHPSINGWIYAGAVSVKSATPVVTNRTFAAAQAIVKKDASNNETDAGKINAAQAAYASALGRPVDQPYTYDSSNVANLGQIRADLGDGRTFTANGATYTASVLVAQNTEATVILTPQVSNALPVTIVPSDLVSLGWAGVTGYQINYAQEIASVNRDMKADQIKATLGDTKQFQLANTTYTISVGVTPAEAGPITGARVVITPFGTVAGNAVNGATTEITGLIDSIKNLFSKQ